MVHGEIHFVIYDPTTEELARGPLDGRNDFLSDRDSDAVESQLRLSFSSLMISVTIPKIEAKSSNNSNNELLRLKTVES